MKSLKVIAAIIAMSCIAFAANYQDHNTKKFTHNIVSSPIGTNKTGYIDLKDYEALRLRDIGAKKINGDIEIIGATISIPSSGGYNFVPSATGSIPQTSVGTKIKFVNEDSGYSFNSSKATFNFSKPKNKNGDEVDVKVKASDVIFARLYWGGGISNLWNTYTSQNFDQMRKRYFDEIKNFNTIKFKTPKDTTPRTLTALETDTKWYGYFNGKGMQFMHQSSVDVTNIIKNMGNTILNNATFSAGDIKSSDDAPKGIIMYRDNAWLGYNNKNWNGSAYSGHFGGWSLVVVYDIKDDAKAKAKSVSIFDGLHVLDPMHRPAGQNIHIKSADLKFQGFYTPTSGTINSSLTVLSFGAKKEVNSEDILIKKGSSLLSVRSALNQDSQGGQFNSNITKFGQYMNSSKVYNNQMDLDTYDISNHITHRQTEAEVTLQAKVIHNTSTGVTLGERANVGLVAFATDAYVPNVCYVEKLFVKGKDEDDDKFREVGKTEDTKTIVKKDSILRVQLTIRNQSNENAEFISIATDMNPNSMVYADNTTYIYPYAGQSTPFTLGDHNPDDTKLQKKIGNNLQFFVGNGAKKDKGGTLEINRQAFIQYDTVLNKDFTENKYTAKFSNAALKLEYDGTIDKCTDYKYHMSIFDIAQAKVVNNSFTKVGDSESLYTQLTGKSFDVKLAYFDSSLSNGDAITGPQEKVKVTGLDIATSCASTTPILNVLAYKGVTGYEFNKNNGIISIPGISIDDNTYPALFFRITYVDPATGLSIIACSDGFAIKPKTFQPYDLAANSIMPAASLTNLIGGRDYPNIGLVAIDNKNKIATNYSQSLETDTTKGDIVDFIPILPTNCNPSAATLSTITADQLRAEFTSGKGSLTKFVKGVAQAARVYRNFSYPNVGAVVLQVTDASYTAIDHANGDCIAGSSDTTGEKIGCNTTAAINFTFVPLDIDIGAFTISNFQNGTMTYMSNNLPMSAQATSTITARLGDADRSPATLYTAGCYARNVNFTIGLDPTQDIPDYTNATGNIIDTAANRLLAARNDIIYFDNQTTPNVARVAGTAANAGQYQALAAAFIDGVANSRIGVNFTRNITVAKNPFAITSNNFTFTNISDTDGVAGAAYTAPAAATNATFYYGRTYAPDYTGPTTGFNALVYYGVFCNGCNPVTYPLIAGVAALPSNPTWFVNPIHNAAMGTVAAYTPNFPSTAVAVTNPVAAGIENIWLSSNVPNTDRIKMQVPSWLLFNASDPTATTNDFSVTFTGVVRWGGQALNEQGADVGVGSVIGGPNLGTSNKTNKRAEW